MYGMNPYDNEIIFDYNMIDEAIFRFVVALMTGIFVVTLVALLAIFLFRAYSLHRIARRRGIRHAWLAWVPAGSDWILGNLADQYRYVAGGSVKNRRLPVLLLSIVMTVYSGYTCVTSAGTLTMDLWAMMEQTDVPMVMPTAWTFALPVILWAVSLALTVLRCVCLYDLYSSCMPRYNTLYTVLGLVFGFLEPVFLFVCRDKEEGMPPRRVVPVSLEPEAVTEE